ncbi:hypothetical protein [Psychroserpens sp.]|uniref:hypothetical protein n=1 Tax=Psychroserpens sp. TaxID=2020870 RepID=UPI00385ACC38
MKKIVIFICLIFISAFSLNAQRKGKTITIDIKPTEGIGFNGSLDLVYAFENCFGDINMLFTYNNVKINSFSYGGRTFTKRDLGIESFEEYLIVPDIYLNSILEPAYFKDGRPRYGGIDGGIQKTIKSNIKLDNVLDKQLAGCYGQTFNLRGLKGINYKFLYIESHKRNYADFSWNATLSEIAKCKIAPNCNLDSYRKNKKDKALANHRYLITITNENRHNDSRFTNTKNRYGRMNASFEIVCENPESLIPSIKSYAHSLFSKVTKYSAFSLCTNCPNDYFVQDIRIEAVENQEHSIRKLSKDFIILPQNFKNYNHYLNTDVESNIQFSGSGSFYITNFAQDCNQITGSKKSSSKKKSYWKN